MDDSDRFADLDDGFGHWLAGFIDGEGCFFISRHPYRDRRVVKYACGMQISVRGDDGAILREAQRRTGLGLIRERRYRDRPDGNWKPQAVWRIIAKGDCIVLVELLERYPLRAKKRRDFDLWRQAVYHWRAARKGCRGHDWGPIERIRECLMQGRAYDAATTVPAVTDPAQLMLAGTVGVDSDGEQCYSGSRVPAAGSLRST